MIKLDFRIDWGYNMLYSRRHYHAVFNWDGVIKSSDNAKLQLDMLEYPPAWWGPCHTAKETSLIGNSWKSSTKRKISGIRIRTTCDENAVFTVDCQMGIFTFSVKDIIYKGHIVFSVGPKYGFCKLIVCRTNYLWFRPKAKENSFTYEAKDLPLDLVDAQRMQLAILKPNTSVEVPFICDNVSTDEKLVECLVHLQAMILNLTLPDMQNHLAGELAFEVELDNKEKKIVKHFFRYHDFTVQFLEDIWVRIPINSKVKSVHIKNINDKISCCISRLICEEKISSHLALTLPKWGLINDVALCKVFATKVEKATICYLGKTQEIILQLGWNEFPLTLDKAQKDIKIKITTQSQTNSSKIDVVYNLKDEPIEVMVGYDMTVVPHDSNGFFDWLLDYTYRTQLGNNILFRYFSYDLYSPSNEEYERWGKFCYEHKIYAHSVNCHPNNVFSDAAKEYMHNAGRHEYPGVVYARDPDEDNQSPDMREASERYIKYLKDDIDEVKSLGLHPAYGDASGGQRYSYLAGASFIRSETMVPHTQLLLSQTRASAEALSKGDWGVHIAMQHNLQLFDPQEHLSLYFLSLYQPWMMGANMIYEEDSLFQLFKEERQCWDDALTKGKRDMTREFFHFAKTHPRKGKVIRKIAFYEGRYAAPFNGFICGSEQSPEYSVWGKFGNNSPEWGHNQVEKGRHLLDVLMPGASVHPLRQKFDKRRFFFSGTPYGDFDQVPAESSSEYLQNYNLIFNLCWNTMLEEDYKKLKDFVFNGGTLFTGLPQFSTHVKRDFIKDMNDLSLWNDGDLSELCGVKIIGKGNLFNGNWNSAKRETFKNVELSRLPNNNFCEDTPCHLADIELKNAQVVAWDSDTGNPIIVKHQFGKGAVYLVCAYAYCGHEVLSDIVSSWMVKLLDNNTNEYFVEDNTKEIFWNYWQEDNNIKKFMLLNTNWTRSSKGTNVKIHTPNLVLDTVVQVDKPKIITVVNDRIIEAPEYMHLELENNNLRVHSCKNGQIIIHSNGAKNIVSINIEKQPYSDIKIDTASILGTLS